LDWNGKLYVFGIPFLAFVLDLLMRRLIKAKRLAFADWCYGADLGLTGVTTCIASLPVLPKPIDLFSFALTFIFSIILWMFPMVWHQAYEPLLESTRPVPLWRARIMLFVVGNLTGAMGLALVLRLMWLK
jgi:hypothetical protein